MHGTDHESDTGWEVDDGMKNVLGDTFICIVQGFGINKVGWDICRSVCL